ncbi:MAG: redox-sensing transcriptional repressor Rex [Anaerolineaceae bacterium]|nr:redox-sensing transcriptional repressor Rex [Anaerolineaceae bacterium]
MAEKTIPDIIVSRLPRYLRALQQMVADGQMTTSSQELGERLGISAAQIRKDLSQFGEFGKQGTGYSIAYLVQQLQTILKVDRVWDMALVGVGDLGHAIARYQGFTNCGFHVVLVFDNDSEKIGKQVDGHTILGLDKLEEAIRGRHVQIAMVTTPASSAQQVTDCLVKAGVKAILNYAPVSLTVPPHVYVQYIDPVIHLQRMTYYLE